jgi:hypothetical protein
MRMRSEYHISRMLKKTGVQSFSFRQVFGVQSFSFRQVFGVQSFSFRQVFGVSAGRDLQFRPQRFFLCVPTLSILLNRMTQIKELF